MILSVSRKMINSPVMCIKTLKNASRFDTFIQDVTLHICIYFGQAMAQHINWSKLCFHVDLKSAFRLLIGQLGNTFLI